MTSDDEQYHAAIKVMRVAKKVSTSYLQRTMGLSDMDASIIIARAEHEGILTLPDSTGKRTFTKPAKPVYTPEQLLGSG